MHWQKPQKINGKLLNYIISYTPDKNWPLESWLNISIPPFQQTAMNCWRDSKEWLGNRQESISVILGNLSSETQYMLLVRAVSQGGIGDPTYPMIINTKISKPLDQASSVNNQKLGKLFIISLLTG